VEADYQSASIFDQEMQEHETNRQSSLASNPALEKSKIEMATMDLDSLLEAGQKLTVVEEGRHARGGREGRRT
jgi:hypothetical protein